MEDQKKAKTNSEQEMGREKVTGTDWKKDKKREEKVRVRHLRDPDQMDLNRDLLVYQEELSANNKGDEEEYG